MPEINFTAAAAIMVLILATAAAAADDSENTVRRGTNRLETIQGGPSAPGLIYVDVSSAVSY